MTEVIILIEKEFCFRKSQIYKLKRTNYVADFVCYNYKSFCKYLDIRMWAIIAAYILLPISIKKIVINSSQKCC